LKTIILELLTYLGGLIIDSGKGFPFPNIIIETAFKNESWDGLCKVIENWMLPQTLVQFAIGKIFLRTG